MFRAVAEDRSFTRARHVLLISQSTVSQHIRELEEQLQVRLFERNRRNVALSAAGVIGGGESVVLVLTGNGLKATDKFVAHQVAESAANLAPVG